MLPIPVGVKEMQNQSAQWLQIRRERPDFVLMWGWGAMNAGALTEAVKTKFPMDKFIGIWWSGHDGDMKSVGEAGKGYRSLSWSVPISDAPAMQDIKKYVVDAEQVADRRRRVRLGVLPARRADLDVPVEGVKAAQAHFDTKVVDRRAAALGLREPQDRRRASSKEIGMTGMIAPFATSCANHTGHAGAWMLEWDGAKFVKVSDLLQADQDGDRAAGRGRGEEICRRQRALADERRVQDVARAPLPA